MAKVRTTGTSSSSKKLKPALTPEARESQLASLAFDLVEQRLLDGTASSQETTHFLKAVSSKARLEKEIMVLQKELVAAKTKSYSTSEDLKQMYADAIKAMLIYSGNGDPDDY